LVLDSLRECRAGAEYVAKSVVELKFPPRVWKELTIQITAFGIVFLVAVSLDTLPQTVPAGDAVRTPQVLCMAGGHRSAFDARGVFAVPDMVAAAEHSDAILTVCHQPKPGSCDRTLR
jgi:hypothetical protein